MEASILAYTNSLHPEGYRRGLTRPRSIRLTWLRYLSSSPPALGKEYPERGDTGRTESLELILPHALGWTVRFRAEVRHGSPNRKGKGVQAGFVMRIRVAVQTRVIKNFSTLKKFLITRSLPEGEHI